MSGVEIPVTLLFADFRGTTAMGERTRPTEFHAFLDHFYRPASEAIVRHDGLVDKIVGDEIVALFFGGNQRTEATRRPPSRPRSTWPSERRAPTLRRPDRFQ